MEKRKVLQSVTFLQWLAIFLFFIGMSRGKNYIIYLAMFTAVSAGFFHWRSLIKRTEKEQITRLAP
jgi:hypothetical protein